jgi:hypothetical protein
MGGGAGASKVESMEYLIRFTVTDEQHLTQSRATVITLTHDLIVEKAFHAEPREPCITSVVKAAP